MGTLRTLFAIAVVIEHSIGNLLVGGRNAVQLFYMISGFLISYVLVERKSYVNVKNFYINRYLRLYPIYLVVAFLTLMALTLASFIGKDLELFHVYRIAPTMANMLLIFSNLTIFFQDWVLFLGIERNQLSFVTHFTKSEVVLYKGLLVPQAWTLGVELTFYMLAPFILFQKKLLIILLVSSILLRLYIISTGLGALDPWTYRFFPTELTLFLLGALAHQVLMPLYKKNLQPKQIELSAKLITYSLILLTLIFSFLPISELLKGLAFFVIFLFGMPLTFIFQSDRHWDKWIGDLSYPIYIGHMLIIYVSTFFVTQLVPAKKVSLWGRFLFLDQVTVGLSAVILSIIFAILLNNFVSYRIEPLRNKLRLTSKIEIKTF